MNAQVESFSILIADNNPEACDIAQAAWDECQLGHGLRFVHDGEELMDYLCHRGNYTDSATAPRPGLILLDLNMPKKDGCEALIEIKSNSRLQDIPVMVLTTSQLARPVDSAFNLCAHSFILKPNTLNEYIELMQCLTGHWQKLGASFRNSCVGDQVTHAGAAC